VEAWRLLPFRRADAAENMAVDEAIFREHTRTKVPPTLRFYGWRTPAVSIGHFQDARREIDIDACQERGIDLVRRPTGGKAVLHEKELTYAVVAGSDSACFPPDILETFRIISRCVIAGLAACGIHAQMKAAGRTTAGQDLDTACFSYPSRYELLVDGRKICGAAQMRSHGAFLQHGALLMEFDPDRTCAVMLPHRNRDEQRDRLRTLVTSVREHARQSVDEETLCRHLRDGFAQILGIRFHEGALTPEEERLKDDLLMVKYGNEQWNREGGMRWMSGL
jgi:lipoyl(octanoyl) transferase